MESLLRRTAALLTPSTSSTNLSEPTQPSSSAPPYIFPKVDPTSDGQDCDHDCDTCEVQYPPKWSIDKKHHLYGHVKGWSTHLLVATGKSDWVRDIADERGSLMQALARHGTDLPNGRCMVSACNMPVPERQAISAVAAREEEEEGKGECEEGQTQVLVLPKWEIVENVSPNGKSVAEFMEGYVAGLPTTESRVSVSVDEPTTTTTDRTGMKEEAKSTNLAAPVAKSHLNPGDPRLITTTSSSSPLPTSQTPLPPNPSPFHTRTRPCPHRALILLCSQKTRDARCGQSAPLLRRELERHLRPLGLYRDLHDERPGGVGIYFISHCGGHKYAANVMVYRRGGSENLSLGGGGGDGEGEGEGEGEKDYKRSFTLVSSRDGSRTKSTSMANRTEEQEEEEDEDKVTTTTITMTTARTNAEALQCIWLARVRPEDCEGIIKHTVLKGKVVKPERQLRGGFDRGRGLVSW